MTKTQVQMKILSLAEASEVLLLPDRGGFTHIVSIGSKDLSPYPCDLEALGLPYLRFEFDDVHWRADNYIHPQWHDINLLINCLRQLSDEANVLFHCQQGRSRSAAAALIFAFLKLKSELDAVKLLLELKPEARPNRLMLVFADCILKSNLRETLASALGHNKGDNFWDTGRYLYPVSKEELKALEVPDDVQ